MGCHKSGLLALPLLCLELWISYLIPIKIELKGVQSKTTLIKLISLRNPVYHNYFDLKIKFRDGIQRELLVQTT